MDIVKILIDAGRAAIGVPAAAYALSAIGLNLQFGYTGLLNFGHVAFMLVGAYGMAITVDLGGPLWLGIPVGILAAVVLGLILGFPTLRLRADYLAIVTIAAGEILRLTVRSSWAAPLTKGIFGIQRFAHGFFDLNPIPVGLYGIGRFRFDERTVWVLIIGWGLVAGRAVKLVAREPSGRDVTEVCPFDNGAAEVDVAHLRDSAEVRISEDRPTEIRIS